MGKCKVSRCKKNARSDGFCKDHAVDEDELVVCKTCNELCESCEIIQCELCESWNHIECVGISEEMFNVLSKIKGTKWFCVGCTTIVNSKIVGYHNYETQTKDLKSSISELKTAKTQFEDLHKKLEKTAKNLTKIDTTIQSTEKSVKKFADFFTADSGPKSAEGFSSSLAKKTAFHLQKSVQQTEDRENNAIMFAVPEQTSASPDERKEKDTNYFKQFCEQALGIDNIPLENIQRIGKRPEDITSSSRPLKICFGTAFDKRKFMASLRNLKNLEPESEFRKVNISHDLSQEQRDETKKLLKTAYDKNQEKTDQSFLWKVRGPPWNLKLVKVKKSD